MTPLNSLASSPGLEVTTFRRWFRTPLESCFAFYLREVWNHIGSEVTKKDDRVSSAIPWALLLANLVRLLTQEDGNGKGDDSRSRLSCAGMRGILVECRFPPSPPSPALNPSSARGGAFVGWRTFRRTEIMKSETQGTYSQSSPLRSVDPQYAGSPSSCRPAPGVLERGDWQKSGWCIASRR